jgi:hypothetical protein
MIAEEVSQPVSLAQILSTRAQHASALRLALDITGGAVVAVAAIVARPKGWVALMSAGVCFLSYGAWAVTARLLHFTTAAVSAPGDAMPATPVSTPRPESRPLWLLLHVASALGGLAAFLLLLFASLALSLGKIIS